MSTAERDTFETPAYDAWVYASLRAGRVLNGELDGVSEANRRFTGWLAGAGDRDRVWGQILDLMPDDEADALVEAVAAADPDAPPPDGAVWEALRLGELPPVEPFPDYVLPEPVADFVRSVAESIGCPPDFVGLSVLVVGGAAVGRSASLILKGGYFVGTSLYGLNVGGPSSGKSPAQEAAVEPMWRADERLHDLGSIPEKWRSYVGLDSIASDPFVPRHQRGDHGDPHSIQDRPRRRLSGGHHRGVEPPD